MVHHDLCGQDIYLISVVCKGGGEAILHSEEYMNLI